MAHFTNTLDIIEKRIQEHSIPENPNFMLGKGLRMPHAASNSGSRKIMNGTQSEQATQILYPEVPLQETGYEMEFGKHSSSFVVADNDLKVIGFVPKYSWMPKHHYYTLFADEENRKLKVIERKEYKHITESYGYLYNNDILDNLELGDVIQKGNPIQKSRSFDEYNNRMDGANMLTIYSACEDSMEDAIIVSESAAKRLSTPLVKKVKIVINDNDIPLNLYGDGSVYKIFPDIGEESVNSILCGLRREKKEECLFSQLFSRLRELSISDERYTVTGRVVDVDIYCNAPEKLGESERYSQLNKYYLESIRVSKDIINMLQPYISAGYSMEYDLQKLYSISAGILNNKGFFEDKVFSNIELVIHVIEDIPVYRGDKLCNRYGGKGVVARVKPDYMMPKTQNGEIVDIILNMCGVYGRENAGQLFEITISFISIKMLEFMHMRLLDPGECIEMYLKFLDIVAPRMSEYMKNFLSTLSDEEVIMFIESMFDNGDKGMYLVIEPMSETMTIDKVKQLYEAFPWAEPEHMLMPTIDSTGKIRYIPSRRPLVYGYQYIYRLKQYAEEKFSVTSLSATNIRNENSKSKNSNNYKALYSRTPIRFGDMETGNLIHLGAELVVQMLMLYSTSPHARRLTQEMLTGDAFNIDVKLDDESKNRNAEILNVYLKTMGLRLEFKKVHKQREHAMEIEPMYFYDNPNKLIEAFIPLNDNEKLDMEKEVLRLLKERDQIHAMDIYPMEFTKDEPNGPDWVPYWCKKSDSK